MKFGMRVIFTFVLGWYLAAGAVVSAGTIYVDSEGDCDGYTPCFDTISEGIAFAAEGDTVYVFSGTYTGTLTAYKSIELVGEDKATTFIDAGDAHYGVIVTASTIRIEGFSIVNSQSIGVVIDGSDVVIADCIVRDHQDGRGFYLDAAGGVLIENCEIHNSNTAMAVYEASHDIEIRNCGIHHHSNMGIDIWSSVEPCSKVKVIGCVLHENSFSGIVVSRSVDVEISDNELYRHDRMAIFVSGGGVLPDNILISRNDIWGNGDGVWAGGGIYLQDCVDAVTIRDNHLWANDRSGIDTIRSSDNVIYHNTFVGNTYNAYGTGVNIWDQGYPIGGNYWDDYTGVDENMDGIGDTPYQLPFSDGQDNYPLMSLDQEVLVIGPGPGSDNAPILRVFPLRQNADHLLEFDAYGTPRYGVNVACGDVDGDGLVEVLTGPGPGAVFGPHVRGFHLHGTPLEGLSFLAYGTNKYGVNVTAGDIDGDGYDEIITGAGPGAVFGPHVRAFDYDGVGSVTPVPGASFFAYGTLKWGVNVAAGDIDGDSFDEIVTGAGPGAVFGPHVRGWNVDGGAAQAIGAVSFLAYGTNKYGVNVSCGDVDGDGIDELVTGPGPGSVFGAHLRGWNHDGAAVEPISGINFFAWPYPETRYGARVFAGADLDGDGRDELVVGCGPDPGAGTPVKIYQCEETQVSEWFSLDAFGDQNLTHGTTVVAGRF